MNQMMPVLKQQADGLASLGRYGDSYIVHAAEGETVIPGEILDANPQLREDLFRQMQMMGIKNPNRYVVGNSLNSINPITGQPEFYWKRLWKATKRALPALGAIVGSRLMPGATAAGTGIGAGLGSLASGKSLKKSALIGGGATLGSALLSSLNSDEKGFGGKVKAFKDALSENPVDAFKEGPISIAQNLGEKEEALTSMRDLPEFVARGSNEALPVLPQYVSSVPVNDAKARQLLSGTPELTSMKGLPELMDREVLTSMRDLPEFNSREVLTSMRDLPEFNSRLSSQGTLTSMRDLPEFATREVLPEMPGNLPVNVTQFDVLNRKNTPVLNRPAGIEALKEAFDPFQPGVLTSGIVGALASEAVDPDIKETTEEQIRRAKELSDPQRAAYDDLYKYPYGSDEYYGKLRQSGIVPSMSAEQLARTTGISLAQAQAYLASKYGVMGADGGEVIGPGTGTSDSIPARLSDGEFVMTAEAVRNAGNGDRDLGAARMYDMMSRFENGRA